MLLEKCCVRLNPNRDLGLGYTRRFPPRFKRCVFGFRVVFRRIENALVYIGVAIRDGRNTPWR